MVYRRFGFLQSRLLLEKQDDLRLLEEELERLDQEEVGQNERILRNRFGINQPRFEKRRDLMKRIEEKFCEYCELLCPNYLFQIAIAHAVSS